LNLLALVRLYGDSFGDAVELLKQGLDEAAENAALRVQMLVALAFALVNTGDMPGALRTVEDGVTAAGELGAPPLISLALGMRVVLRVMRGDGFDEASMRKALTHEEATRRYPWRFVPRRRARCCWVGWASLNAPTSKCSPSAAIAWNVAKKVS
jgi:hypothetical protein